MAVPRKWSWGEDGRSGGPKKDQRGEKEIVAPGIFDSVNQGIIVDGAAGGESPGTGQPESENKGKPEKNLWLGIEALGCGRVDVGGEN